MIKKQYRRGKPGYFTNFINAHSGEEIIEDYLKPYGGIIAKSNNKFYKMNVKWSDPVLYSLFVLRWS